MASADQPMLELAIETIDDDSVRAIERSLPGVEVQRWPATRDVATVISIASSAVSLIEALLTLKNHLQAQRHPPKVTVKNAERDEIVLVMATREDLAKLLAG